MEIETLQTNLMTREFIEDFVAISKQQNEMDIELGKRCLEVVQPIIDSKNIPEMKEAKFYVVEFFGDALDYSVQAIIITEKINDAIKQAEFDSNMDAILNGLIS